MSGSNLVIRPSRDGDLAAIAAIYSYHVLHGVASFEEIPPEPEEIARRRRDVLAQGLPFLVAEQAGRVLGYCYASLYRTRSAYRFTLEDSVYVDTAEVGRGIGRMLLSALIERCSELGYRQLVAVIGGSNQWPSIRLHEALGFTRSGVLTAVGFKFWRLGRYCFDAAAARRRRSGLAEGDMLAIVRRCAWLRASPTR